MGNQAATSLLKKACFVAVALLMAMLFVAGGTFTQTAHASTTSAIVLNNYKSYSMAFEVLNLVNAERAKKNLKPLVMDAELMNAAMTRAAETRIKFDHTRPDGSYCTSISSKVYAENIAAGRTTAAGVMDQWMNSSTHYANIMSSKVTTIGIGCVGNSSSECMWWCQLFGTESKTTSCSRPSNTAVVERFKVNDSKLINTNFKFRSNLYQLAKGGSSAVEILWTNENADAPKTQIHPSAFTFSIADSSVASINSSGLLTGLKTGQTTLYASVPNTNVRISVPVYVSNTAQNSSSYSSSSSSSSSTSSNARVSGWQVVGNNKYYYSNGVKVTGWKTIFGMKYYFNTSGVMQTGWKTISNKKYYFNSNGVMQTGLKTIGGKKYYFSTSGVMQTGWKTISKKKYYFNSSGQALSGLKKLGSYYYYFNPSNNQMSTGWKSLSGKWYYFNGSTGRAASGLTKISGSRYYFNTTNKRMVIGWKYLSGKWYYFKSNGKAATGWMQIGRTWYYFYSSGVMAKSTWIGRDHVSASGAWDRSR